MKSVKIIAFDIDETLCTINKKNQKKINKYYFARPLYKNIKLLNKLYQKGHYIKLYTSRGMTRYKKNVKKIKNKYEKLTKNQLIKWKVNYHELIFGKENYDIIVDDKSVNISKKINLNKLI